ncbi:putative actin lateral binding protein [Diaporthe ampelina]|uniref:Putative actin lateral binding protein n=1 Tax=Diaporthe ampelina TaxID=1214573 RepID=A0A0G2FJ66_9PEZI|nr:putative actin lateral binding protein [Diaporthe ampelina]
MSILSSVSQKMNQLRLEADDSAAKVEELQAKVKTLEQENLSKEQDITSLQHKNGLLEGEVEKLETAIKDFKKAAEDGTQHSTTNESLTRRLQLLEEEAEEADKTLREANEKWVAQYYTFKSHDYLTWRLRQTDVKAGHFERKVQALESERDQWESKYEEMSKKYADIKKELEEFQAEIGNI